MTEKDRSAKRNQRTQNHTSVRGRRTRRECLHTQEVVATEVKGGYGTVLCSPERRCPGLAWRKGSYSSDQPSERNTCGFYTEPRFLNLPLEICTHRAGDQMGAELVPVMRVRGDIVACCSELEF